MNIVGISFGYKELPKRQFNAKMRNAILQNKEKQELEFHRLLAEGILKKDEKGKVEFRMPDFVKEGL